MRNGVPRHLDGLRRDGSRTAGGDAGGRDRENGGLALSLAARRHEYQPVRCRVRHRIDQKDGRPRHEQQEEGARKPMPLARTPLVQSAHRVGKLIDQLVQASVAGVVVEVAAPPVAVIPVSDGKEK